MSQCDTANTTTLTNVAGKPFRDGSFVNSLSLLVPKVLVFLLADKVSVSVRCWKFVRNPHRYSRTCDNTHPVNVLWLGHVAVHVRAEHIVGREHMLIFKFQKFKDVSLRWRWYALPSCSTHTVRAPARQRTIAWTVWVYTHNL